MRTHIFFLSHLLVVLPLCGTVINVNCENSPADASKLNTAMAGGAAGDQFLIHGICLIDKTVLLKGDTTFAGDSRTGTVLRQADGSNLPALLASDSWASGYPYPAFTGGPVHVAHLTLDGNKAMNTGTSALVLRSWMTVVEDLYVENAPSDGIQITNLTQSGVALSNNQVNGRISNVFVTGSGANGIHVVDSGNAVTDWDLLDSWIAYSGASAISMDNAAGWKIRGNHLYGNPVNGIFANRCFATAIEGNYIEDFGSFGGSGNTYFGIACTVQGGAGSVISNNKVFQFHGDAASGSLVYIGVPEVNYGTGVVNVTGNLVVGADGSNTTGILLRLGGGKGLKADVAGNNLQSVKTGQKVDPGVTLVGQPCTR